MMKVWVTKFALTTGIFEAETARNPDSSMIVVRNKFHDDTYYHKPYWHETKEAAIEHAENLRTKKLRSLNMQIGKLAKIKFT